MAHQKSPFWWVVYGSHPQMVGLWQRCPHEFRTCILNQQAKGLITRPGSCQWVFIFWFSFSLFCFIEETCCNWYRAGSESEALPHSYPWVIVDSRLCMLPSSINGWTVGTDRLSSLRCRRRRFQNLQLLRPALWWKLMSYWLVVYLPLWKIWVRQLGWWNSQLVYGKS